MMQSETRYFALRVRWSLLILACTCQPLQAHDPLNQEDAATCLQADSQGESSFGKQLLQRSTSGAAASLSNEVSEDQQYDLHAAKSSQKVAGRKTGTISQYALGEEVASFQNASKAISHKKVRHSRGTGHHHESRGHHVSTAGMIACVVIVLVVLSWSSPRNHDPDKFQSAHTDNAAVAIQFLVIYGNLCSSNVTPYWGEPKIGASDWQTWLSGSSDLLTMLADGFWAVSVPMQCFLLGLLSQGPTTETKIRRFVETIVVPTFLWVFFAKPVIHDTMMDASPAGFFERLTLACQFKAFHEEWFLQSLILWQASAFMIWSHLRPSVSFICMVALSAVAGYLNLNGPLWYLKLDDALGYLPYFAIGYFCPYVATCKLTERSRLPKLLAISLVILWVYAIIPLAGVLPSSQGNYQSYGAGAIFRELHGTKSQSYRLYWMRRVARVALETPPCIVLMFYVIPRKPMPLTWVGQHWLYPYLFHQVANYWRSVLVRHLQPPIVTSAGGHVAVLMLHLPYAIGILMFLASRPFRIFFSWCFEPTWLKMALTTRLESRHEKVPKLWSQDIVKQFPKGGSRSMEKAASASKLAQASSTEAGSSLSAASPTYGNAQQNLAEGTHSDNKGPDLDPELELSHPVHKHKRWFSTGADLLPQAPARRYYKFLWLLFSLKGLQTIAPIVALRWYFSDADSFAEGLNYVAGMVPIPTAIVIGIFYLALTPALYIYHYSRLRGTDKLPEPTGAPPMHHAVVVVAYKEPLEVLMRTIRTIVAQRGLGHKPMLVFASEDRDPTAQDSFQHISREIGDRLDLFLMSKHKLTEGETVGKSSNENWAVQQLYQLLVEEQGHDPFEVMVTIVDADSLLSETYCAQAEASLRNMCDGRRFIYSGPLNTYRNFGDANMLVQAYELNRCHSDVFHNPFAQYNPQSNYSLTLGFAQELGFWTPDVMPEDIHTANRAMVHNFGSQTTVAIPSFICNDIVTDFGDRYTQAIRHQFGSVTEVAWTMAMWLDVKKMSLQLWYCLFRQEYSRDGSFFAVANDLASFFIKWYLFIVIFMVRNELSDRVGYFLLFYAILQAWRVLWFWIAELTLWQTLLRQFPIEHASAGRWCLIILLFPVFMFVGEIVFYLGATVHSVIRITTVGELTYVAAPKGDAKQGLSDKRADSDEQQS